MKCEYEVIAEVSKSWIGTPFYPHMAKKGVGADCVMLARAIYIESGIMPESVILPQYRLDQGDHLRSSIVLRWLIDSGLFEPSDEIHIGSLITVKYGRVVHHVGVVSGWQKFIHSIRDYGVIESDLRDSTWIGKLNSIWRPKCLSCLEAQKH